MNLHQTYSSFVLPFSLQSGGGSYGLMGAIARTIHEGGGKVIGVIPEALKKIERPGTHTLLSF
jgi:predicted Rossmann-fold nucleotide-binding protein